MQRENYSEKRKHPRIQWGFLIRQRLFGRDVKWEDLSVIRDISLGGCSFKSQRAYQVDDVLEIAIKLPGRRGSPILMGQVKRCEPTHVKNLFFVAVAFQPMTDDQREILQGALEFLIKKSS